MASLSPFPIQPARRSFPTSAVSPFSIPADSIATIYRGRFGCLQLLRCTGENNVAAFSGTTHGYHLIVPLAGAFVWHRSGKEPVFANSNTLLHVEANEEYHVTHPAGAELSVVIWPSREMVDRLRLSNSNRIDLLPVSMPCSSEIHLMVRNLVAIACRPADRLKFEEQLIAMIGAIFAKVGCKRGISPKSMRAVNRAKEYIHNCIDERLTLSEIAEAVEVNPIYLTQLFSAAEGVPLHRYILDLKLNAALDRLPQCDDLTNLALDLGFSSHSHFSSEFSRRFGIPPSVQRAAAQQAMHVRERLVREQTIEQLAGNVELAPLCEARGGILY